MKRLVNLMLAGAIALPIAACGEQAEEPAGEMAATETVPSGGVVREEMGEQEAAAAAPVPAMTVIQSQPGPDGSQVDLLSAKVTGDILTVTLRCSSSERVNSENFRIADISIIDDATAQRANVLRDNDGRALVSNFNKSSSPDYDTLGAECETRPGVIWAKFPAPAATTQTISINFPEVAPFDGVTVQR